MHITTTPRTPAALHAWLRHILDVDIPITPLNETDTTTATPFDYLCFTFFEHLRPPARSPDCVVWASRGGGKTFYAAVATILDLVFKPGIEIKVLGGSLDQSRRMHEHLRRFLERPLFQPLLDAKPTDRRARLINNSSVEVLAQSHTSVRGTRPQKLRCDEVELFDPDVWRAAQLVTRSKTCGIPPGESQPVHVRGTIEALSTLHKPSGLMSHLISTAAPIPRYAQHASLQHASRQHESLSPLSGMGLQPVSTTSPTSDTQPPTARNPRENQPRTLFRWTVLDVLEHCPPHRHCDTCDLFDECQGRAKLPRHTQGHLTIDDAIILKRRADAASWHAEMLCNTPRISTAVFPEYDERTHILRDDALIPTTAPILGMDFGYRGDTAILWATLTPDHTLLITHERVQANTLLDDHIQAIKQGNPSYRSLTSAPHHLITPSRHHESPSLQTPGGMGFQPVSTPTETSDTHPSAHPQTLPSSSSEISSLNSQITHPNSGPPLLPPAWIAADPAGAQRSITTGLGPVHVMRQHGLVVRTPRLSLHEGLTLIRRRLAPAQGPPRLLIHPRCNKLRHAFHNYRYHDNAQGADPIKDGHDHPIDALRYLITTLDHHHTTKVTTY